MVEVRLRRASTSAQRGCEPQLEFSSRLDGEVLGILGPLFDDSEGTGALDALVLALDATG